MSERLIGASAYATLDVDYLTDHVTNLVLAALGRLGPLGPYGEATDATEMGEVGVPCRGSR